jgi:hypothetical protein
MKSIILGIVRHLLTAFGGGLSAQGLATSDDIAAAIGAAVTLIGFAWSVFEKYRARPRPSSLDPRPSSLPLLILVPLAFSLSLGCATWQGAAYKSLGSTAVLVDGAMRAWAGYVVQERAAHPDQLLALEINEAKVRLAYSKYQAAMRVAREVIAQTEKDKTTAKPAWDKSLSAVEAASGELADLVRLLMSQSPTLIPLNVN